MIPTDLNKLYEREIAPLPHDQQLVLVLKILEPILAASAECGDETAAVEARELEAAEDDNDELKLQFTEEELQRQKAALAGLRGAGAGLPSDASIRHDDILYGPAAEP